MTLTKQNCINYLIKIGNNEQEAKKAINKYYDSYMERNPKAVSVKKVAKTLFQW